MLLDRLGWPRLFFQVDSFKRLVLLLEANTRMEESARRPMSSSLSAEIEAETSGDVTKTKTPVREELDLVVHNESAAVLKSQANFL